MFGRIRSNLMRYGLVILLTLAFVVLQKIPTLGPGTVSLIYVVVFLSARYGGRGPGLFATGLLVSMIIMGLRNDGRPIDDVKKIQFLLFVVSGVMITSVVESLKDARRRAEANADDALHQSERLRTTLQSIGDAVVVADLRGHVVSLNPVAERLMGWSQAEAEGRPLSEVFRIVNEETRRPVDDPVALVLTHKKTVGLANHTILISRTGTECPIADSAAPIRDARGEVGGVVLVFRDTSARRDWERRLAEAEARFRAFMDHSPVVAFIKDEYGRYQWGNAAWKRQHMANVPDPIGLTDRELWPEATARLFRESDLATFASGGPVELAEQGTNADGSTVDWMTMKFPLGHGPGGRLIGGISIDVSHRSRAERAIRASEERYRLLFDANPHPMWVFDVESRGFLEVNEAAVRHYGYTPEQFLAMTIDQIRPADELPRLNGRLRHLDAPSFVPEMPWRHKKQDGTIIDVEIASHSIVFNGRPSRLVLAHDVTERRQAEEALRISRERLDLAIIGGELGLWYCDLPGAKLTLNDRARTQFGFTSDEVATLDSYLARVHLDDRESVRTAIRRAVELRGSFDLVHRVRDVENEPRWIRVVGKTYADDSGVANRFDGISIDVSEQKAREEQLRDAKIAADVANQAKTRFLAMVGHELRTPLTPIVASLSAILDAEGMDSDQAARTPEDMRDLLSMIRRNVELETRLIGDLLDVSRVERGELKLEFATVDLHEAIRGAVDICRDAIAASGFDVKLTLAADNHHVRGDHARLMQIVWNLVQNAAKFARPNGRLTIRTSEFATSGKGSRDSRLIVEFVDDGMGIEPDVLRRIFDPFEQGSVHPPGRQKGLGLGLAISRSIAEAHGGTLSAMSPGRNLGSTFRLTLEVTPARPGVERQAAPIPNRDVPRYRILLVEDNVDTLRYLEILLKQRGYSVESARFMSEALDLAEASTFDVIVSDLELPDGSGLDLMRALRGKMVGIAVSGFGSEADVEVSLEAGFSAHLTKPVDFQRLDAAIRQALTGDRAD